MMAMKHEHVKSSNIHSVGYDPDARILQITFKPKAGGKIAGNMPMRTYEFHDVPADVHKDLMAAESHGQHFFANIRNNYKGIQI